MDTLYYENISKLLLTYCKEGYLCDTVIAADGKALNAHSILLAAASPYLKSKLDGQAERDTKCIVLSDIDYETLCVAVYFIYTGNLMLPANRTEEYYAVMRSALLGLGLDSARINSCKVFYDRQDELCFSNFPSTHNLGDDDLIEQNEEDFNMDVDESIDVRALSLCLLSNSSGWNSPRIPKISHVRSLRSSVESSVDDIPATIMKTEACEELEEQSEIKRPQRIGVRNLRHSDAASVEGFDSSGAEVVTETSEHDFETDRKVVLDGCVDFTENQFGLEPEEMVHQVVDNVEVTSEEVVTDGFVPLSLQPDVCRGYWKVNTSDIETVSSFETVSKTENGEKLLNESTYDIHLCSESNIVVPEIVSSVLLEENSVVKIEKPGKPEGRGDVNQGEEYNIYTENTVSDATSKIFIELDLPHDKNTAGTEAANEMITDNVAQVESHSEEPRMRILGTLFSQNLSNFSVLDLSDAVTKDSSNESLTDSDNYTGNETDLPIENESLNDEYFVYVEHKGIDSHRNTESQGNIEKHSEPKIATDIAKHIETQRPVLDKRCTASNVHPIICIAKHLDTGNLSSCANSIVRDKVSNADISLLQDCANISSDEVSDKCHATKKLKATEKHKATDKVTKCKATKKSKATKKTAVFYSCPSTEAENCEFVPNISEKVELRRRDCDMACIEEIIYADHVVANSLEDGDHSGSSINSATNVKVGQLIPTNYSSETVEVLADNLNIYAERVEWQEESVPLTSDTFLQDHISGSSIIVTKALRKHVKVEEIVEQHLELYRSPFTTDNDTVVLETLADSALPKTLAYNLLSKTLVKDVLSEAVVDNVSSNALVDNASKTPAEKVLSKTLVNNVLSKTLVDNVSAETPVDNVLTKALVDSVVSETLVDHQSEYCRNVECGEDLVETGSIASMQTDSVEEVESISGISESEIVRTLGCGGKVIGRIHLNHDSSSIVHFDDGFGNVINSDNNELSNVVHSDNELSNAVNLNCGVSSISNFYPVLSNTINSDNQLSNVANADPEVTNTINSDSGLNVTINSNDELNNGDNSSGNSHTNGPSLYELSNIVHSNHLSNDDKREEADNWIMRLRCWTRDVVSDAGGDISSANSSLISTYIADIAPDELSQKVCLDMSRVEGGYECTVEQIDDEIQLGEDSCTALRADQSQTRCDSAALSVDRLGVRSELSTPRMDQSGYRSDSAAISIDQSGYWSECTDIYTNQSDSVSRLGRQSNATNETDVDAKCSEAHTKKTGFISMSRNDKFELRPLRIMLCDIMRPQACRSIRNENGSVKYMCLKCNKNFRTLLSLISHKKNSHSKKQSGKNSATDITDCKGIGNTGIKQGTSTNNFKDKRNTGDFSNIADNTNAEGSANDNAKIRIKDKANDNIRDEDMEITETNTSIDKSNVNGNINSIAQNTNIATTGDQHLVQDNAGQQNLVKDSRKGKSPVKNNIGAKKFVKGSAVYKALSRDNAGYQSNVTNNAISLVKPGSNNNTINICHQSNTATDKIISLDKTKDAVISNSNEATRIYTNNQIQQNIKDAANVQIQGNIKDVVGTSRIKVAGKSSTFNKCQCSICNRIFPNVLTLRRHQRANHKKERMKSMTFKQVVCNFCGLEFRKPSELAVHLKKPHHSCDRCRAVFINTHQLSRHRLLKHGIKPTSATLNQKVPDVGTPNQEMIVMFSNFVGKSSTSQGVQPVLSVIDRQDHVLEVPKELPIKTKPPVEMSVSVLPCGDCGMSFNDELSLINHAARHGEGVPKEYRCEVCGQAFGTLKIRRLHSSRFHSNETAAGAFAGAMPGAADGTPVAVVGVMVGAKPGTVIGTTVGAETETFEAVDTTVNKIPTRKKVAGTESEAHKALSGADAGATNVTTTEGAMVVAVNMKTSSKKVAGAGAMAVALNDEAVKETATYEAVDDTVYKTVLRKKIAGAVPVPDRTAVSGARKETATDKATINKTTSHNNSAVPMTHNAVPTTHKAVSMTHKTVPMTHKTVPMTRKAVPMTHKAVPMTRKAVPMTHKAVARALSGAIKKTMLRKIGAVNETAKLEAHAGTVTETTVDGAVTAVDAVSENTKSTGAACRGRKKKISAEQSDDCSYEMVGDIDDKLNFYRETTTLDGNKYQCRRCGEVCNTYQQMRAHLNYHVGIKYLCKICKRSFDNYDCIKKHVTLHSNERPHTCSECGKCFRDPSHLHSHKFTHSGSRAFSCLKCGKGFHYRAGLLSHYSTQHQLQKDSTKHTDKNMTTKPS